MIREILVGVLAVATGVVVFGYVLPHMFTELVLDLKDCFIRKDRD